MTRLALVVALGLMLVPAAFADPDEYDLLRARWQGMITGGTSYDPLDPVIAPRIAAIDSSARGAWNPMDKSSGRTYLWSDLASATISAHVSNSYARLRAMALAYATHGSSLEGDPALLGDLIGGLDWMFDSRYNTTRPRYDNWWDWEIGTPVNLNDIVVLIYDNLNADQIANYMATIERFTPEPALTAANRVDKTKVVAVRGIIVKSGDKLALARDGLSDLPSGTNSVFQYVNSGDGFYADGSFIQHGKHAYTGSYGSVQLSGVAYLMYLLSGSTWQITDPDQQNVYNWVYWSFQPLIYKGAMMSMVRGRAISRTDQEHGGGHGAIASIVWIAQFAPPADSSAFKSMIKYWIETDTFRSFLQNALIPTLLLAREIVNDPGVVSRGELIGHLRYARMDRVVHLRPGFGFAVSMSSNRIFNYECINNENLKGWYTGDGMTYLYNADLGQYSTDFWPTVDPHRLAGTTVDTRSRANCSGQGYAQGQVISASSTIPSSSSSTSTS